MKLNYKSTFFIGLAFMSISTFWVIYDSIIPLILKDTYALSNVDAGIVMSMDNILALVLLPLFGFFSDRTKTRLGKRMPYVIVGTAVSVVLMIFIPVVANSSQSVFVFIAALACLLIALSSYRSPAVSLMPDVTPKHLRSKANAVINLMGVVGAIIAYALIALLVPKVDLTAEVVQTPNYVPLFLSIAGVMIIAVIILVVTIRENKLVAAMPKEELEEPFVGAEGKLDRAHLKSLIFLLFSVAFWFMGYNAVTSVFTKYALQVWHLQPADCAPILMVAQGAALLSFFPIGVFSIKYGRKKTVMTGVTLLIAAFFFASFIHNVSWYITLLFVIAGFGWAAINVNSYPMVVEMSKGSNVGKYTGYYYSFSMAAQIVTPILSGWLLDHLGYWTLFPYACICAILAFISMLFVRHGDSKPEKPKSKLEAFDVQD